MLGFSLLHFPYRFHSMALFALYPSGLSMWPIQHQALCIISRLSGCCPLCFQSSSLQIHLGHQFLRFLMLNLCNFFFNPLVSCQVSEPYRGLAFTFDSKDSQLALDCECCASTLQMSALLSHCVIPENIHTSLKEGIFSKTPPLPHPSGNSN